MSFQRTQFLNPTTISLANSDDIISESPAKKRKTENNNSGGYQSENDSGDDLFADNHDTIATYVLPQTQPQKNTIPQPDLPFENLSQTQVNHGSIALEPFTTQQHQTQPTQILSSTLPGRRKDIRGTETRTGVATDTVTNTLTSKDTNSAAAAAAAAAKPIIQVEASSPISEHDHYATAAKPAAPTIKGGILANAMAPPGTFFRKPFGSQQTPQPAAINSEEEDPPVEPISSDDELTSSRADIRPSAFASSGRSHTLGTNGTSSFKDITSRFAYSEKDGNDVKDSSVSAKRAADDMASAYGLARRNKPARQTAPSRAMPVQQDMELDDIPDYGFRQKVMRMSMIYPNKTVAELHDALVRKKGNYNDAIDYVLELEDKAEVDLSKSDDGGNDDVVFLPKLPPAPKPTTKRQVRAPNRTIQEKWSSTQAAKGMPLSPQKPEPLRITLTDTPPKPKPRRRLIRGRKEPSSPAVSSPERNGEISKRHNGSGRVSNAITIDSDTPSESSASGSETDDDTEAGELEGQLIDFLNKCSLEDLVDLSNQSEDVGKAIIGNRPFRNLSTIREVTIEPTDESSTITTKTGKKKTKNRKPVGDKVVDVCLEMWTGYDAVDRLVKRCEELGKPLAAEMESWGFDVFGISKDGELQLTSRKREDGERPRDSGIGTPSSSAPVEEVEVAEDDDDDENEVKIIGRKNRNNVRDRPESGLKFLSQPECMTKDRPMKEYQLVGLNWLNLLWTKKLSCILADDMGLGKTCQVIAFLSHLYESTGTLNDKGKFSARGPHLIIVPGSTLENWLREFQMFSPQLLVEPYYGMYCKEIKTSLLLCCTVT